MPTRIAVLIAFCTALLLLSASARAQSTDTLLTLDEAVHIALENNHGIRIARNEAQIARNNYTRGNAGFYPTVGLSAQNSQSAILSTRDGSFGGNTLDVGAGLSYTLFDGAARSARYRRLGVLREQGVLDAERVAETALADVHTVYYAVARQQQQVTVQREAVGISEERLRIADLRRDLGSASDLEARRARVDLNADRAALLRQEAALSETRTELNRILGRAADTVFRVTDAITVAPALDLDQLTGAAEEQNRALRLAESRRAAAELARREISAEWLPRVDLQLGYAFSDATRTLWLPGRQPGGFNYGVSASFDIFEGNNRSRRSENARLDIYSAELETQEIRTQLQADLRNAFTEYRSSLALIDLEEENVELAALNVEVALEQFELGTITSLELREVQTALLDARSRLVAATFEAKHAETILLLLAGQLLAPGTVAG